MVRKPAVTGCAVSQQAPIRVRLCTKSDFCGTGASLVCIVPISVSCSQRFWGPGAGLFIRMFCLRVVFTRATWARRTTVRVLVSCGSGGKPFHENQFTHVQCSSCVKASELACMPYALFLVVPLSQVQSAENITRGCSGGERCTLTLCQQTVSKVNQCVTPAITDSGSVLQHLGALLANLNRMLP